MKLNLGSGAHPLEGFLNLDRPEWEWGKPLPYPDESVDAVTISHSLMYCPLEMWPEVFQEIARVMKPNGVLRVTEDATDDPASPRYGGFGGAVALTSAGLVKRQMLFMFYPYDVEPNETSWHDNSLIQRWHGEPPKVFHVEGIRC